MRYAVMIFVVTCIVIVWAMATMMIMDMWHELEDEEDDYDSFV